MAVRTSTNSVSLAIDEWSLVLGKDKVSSEKEILARYARTTQADAPSPSCILYPTTTEEVQAVVRIASKYDVVVYPISRGKNWGYGDMCAPTDGAAIIDLSRMNRIHEVNTELAYCVIEPGVSQIELYNYLQENNTGLWMDATAAGPDSSLVGNTVDRGFGHTKYGDHFQTCSGMEIVLADGRVLNTGFGHYENAKATRVYPYGVGPYLDGIFGQSNYGIVTKIGLWLLPEPEAFNFFFVQVKEWEGFEMLVDRLRPLKLSGVINTAVHVGNDFRVLAGSSHYPWEEAKGETPLPQHLRMKLREKSSAQAWQGSGSITGTKGQVRAARKAIRKALKGVAVVKFVDDRKLKLGLAVAAFLQKFGMGSRLAWRMEILKPNYELLKGIPAPEPLYGAQWRLRNPPRRDPADPLDLGVGLYWVSPVMPMVGAEAMTLQKLVEPIFTAHGFDMVVSFILLTERSLVAIFNVVFDKSVPEESEKASQCYEALVDAMMSNGYKLYRAGLQGMPKMREDSSVFWDVATQIKKALDPQDIIARGRYIAPLDKTDQS